MADGGIGEAALAEAAFDSAAFEGLAAADVLAPAAVSTLAGSGAALNAFEPYAFEGISQYMGQAPINPIAQAVNAGNIANVTGSAPGAFQGINQLNAAQTADLMRNIDPQMINSLAPTDVPVSDVVSKGVPINGGDAAVNAQMNISQQAGSGTPFSGYQTPDLVPNAYGSSNYINSLNPPSFLDQASGFAKEYKMPLMTAGAGLGLRALMNSDQNRYGVPATQTYNGPLSKFHYDPSTYQPDIVKPPTNPYQARYAGGGPVEQMSNNAALGTNTMYPMANMRSSAFATPYQTPQSTNMMSSLAPSGGGTVDQMSGEPNMQGTRFASGGAVPRFGLGGFLDDAVSSIGQGIGDAVHGVGNVVNNAMQGRVSMANPDYGNYSSLNDMMEDYRRAQSGNAPAQYSSPNVNANVYKPQYASGGIASLGSYSDGGRMLKGPGDGMSDDIPARIGGKQEARLADGEFVVPADVVSHLGNGSTDAGAKQLYSMMDKVRQARTGRKSQGSQIKPNKYMPA
jgi:hypothetical protein